MAATVPGSNQRPRSIGILNVAGGLAPVLGVVLGGPAVDAIGWRVLFVLAAIPARIAWVLALFVLGETTKRPDVTFDSGLALGATFRLLHETRRCGNQKRGYTSP